MDPLEYVWRYPKDPDDVADYTADWTDRLAGDVITASEWIVNGLQVVSEGHTTKTTTVWLEGGIANRSYSLTNRVTTQGGRTLDQTIRLRVAHR